MSKLMIYPIGLDTVLTFGKYEGDTVEQIADSDPLYLDWCIENVRGFELDNEAYDYVFEDI